MLGSAHNSVNRLGTTGPSFPVSLSISAKHLSVYRPWRRESDEHGPDLAFIRIPAGEFLAQLKKYRSFKHIGLDLAMSRDAALGAKNSLLVVAGYPSQLATEGVPQLGFEEVSKLACTGAKTHELSYFDHDGFDYIDAEARLDDEDGRPRTLGGMSGGGLWAIPVHRKAGDPPGTEYFINVHLVGVIFWESDPRKYPRTLRAHGPRSIYGRFLPKLFEELGITFDDISADGDDPKE